jgi:Phage integrase, N-terminal SAM-like domain
MPEHPNPAQPRLLDRVRDAMRRRHYSYRTEQAYIHWIKRYIWFHDRRHPAEMGAAEVTAFLSHPPAIESYRPRRRTRRCRRCSSFTGRCSKCSCRG